MDDCNLSRLEAKPIKLNPLFKKDILEYFLELPSNLDKFTLDLLTSDSGASYCIYFPGGDGGKTVALTEGESKEIRIEVTAEDGRTVKNYCVKASRLSSKDAFLNSLAISRGELQPVFNKRQFEYNCVVGADVNSLQVTGTVLDSKCVISIQGQPPSGTTTNVPLLVGRTSINIQVTSADGSRNQNYVICVQRNDVPFVMWIDDDSARLELEDPFSLNPYYCPITVRDSNPKRTYSTGLVQHVTRTDPHDPLDHTPLTHGWDVDDLAVERKLAAEKGFLILPSGPTGTKLLSDLHVELSKGLTDKKAEITRKFNAKNWSHQISTRPWEKALHQIFDESEPNKLVQHSEQALQKYFALCPSQAVSKHKKFDEDSNPLVPLNTAIYCIACALKAKPKDAGLHSRLGALLEEKYWLEDLYGVKSDEPAATSSTVGFSSENQAASSSAKEDEIRAICQLRGYAANCSVSLQLKALDEEYHTLKENNQSAKADAIQNLFLWKSKQTSQEGLMAQKAESAESCLGQAYLKYCDALSADESKAVHNYHVGRLLLIQGKYKEAIERLDSALSWNAKHEAARFCLAIALSQCKDYEKDTNTLKEAVELLFEGWNNFSKDLLSSSLADMPLLSSRRETLLADSPFHIMSLLLVRGLAALGKLLTTVTIANSKVTSEQALLTCAKLVCLLLPRVVTSKDSLSRKQLEWTLVYCHSRCLEQITQRSREQPQNLLLRETVAWRARCLNVLVERSNLPLNEDILQLQEMTCKLLVSVIPRHSLSLAQLGQALIVRAESRSGGSTQNDAMRNQLKEAIDYLELAVELEGQPTTGEIPSQIKGREWFAVTRPSSSSVKPADNVERKLSRPSSKTSISKTGVKPAAPPPVTRTSGSIRGGAGAALSRGAATSSRGGGTASKPSAPIKAVGPSRGGAATAAGLSRGGTKTTIATTRKLSAEKKPSSGDSPAAGGSRPSSATAVKPSPPPPAAQQRIPQKSGVPHLNPIRSHIVRLALARACRLLGNYPQALQWYRQVFEIAPDLHDAYVESAEMLMQTNDLLSAVDVYCLMPVPNSNSLTFEDAFVFGEIVRILMKCEKYDDPRLPNFMILWAKVMGFGILDKYIRTLEDKMKTGICRTVYAGVNGKSQEDPQLKQFFKMKMWD